MSDMPPDSQDTDSTMSAEPYAKLSVAAAVESAQDLVEQTLRAGPKEEIDWRTARIKHIAAEAYLKVAQEKVEEHTSQLDHYKTMIREADAALRHLVTLYFNDFAGGVIHDPPTAAIDEVKWRSEVLQLQKTTCEEELEVLKGAREHCKKMEAECRQILLPLAEDLVKMYEARIKNIKGNVLTDH